MSESEKKPRKNKLKINEDKGVLTIQGQDLAVQSIFNWPILEVCNYQEHLAKYNYRAALSSINLKVEQFDYYYSQVKEKAENLYHSLIYRSLDIFQDLIIGVKFARVELWN